MKIDIQIDRASMIISSIVAVVFFICFTLVYDSYRENNIRQTLADKSKPVENEPVFKKRKR